MKKIIVVAFPLMISVNSFSQSISPQAPSVKTDYLEKSRSQKITAWVFAGGGLALILTAANIREGGNIWEDLLGLGNYKNACIKSVLGWVGFFSTLGSIPFFINSRDNKKKAMSLSFKNETIPLVQYRSFASQSLPSITFKINL